MSSGSHHGANEENILAMLERDAGRQRQGNSRRFALYVAAAVLVPALLGSLGWLLAENNSATDKLRAEAQRGVSVTLVEEKPKPSQRQAASFDDPVTGLGGATIIDSREAPLLPNREVPLPASGLADTSHPPRLPAGERQDRVDLSTGGIHSPAQLARAGAVRNDPLASIPVRSVPTRSTAPAQSRKPAATETMESDSDVALISAIIMMTGKHSGEPCVADGSKKCGTAPAAQP